MAEGLRSIRPLGPESLRGVEPKPIGNSKPKIEWVSPRDLYVEDVYQRSVAENGVTLVRKVVAGFSWSKFKVPACVRLPEFGNVLVVIDGQHTAIACASHPGVDKIPVLVVSAKDAAERARSFVGHNRDRINLTPPAIFRAELVAGDEQAVAVDAACRAAGATVMPFSVNLRDKHAVGSTIAIGTLKAVLKKDGPELLVRTLKVLIAAGRGPIKAGELSACAMILSGFGDDIEDAKLSTTIAAKTAEGWAAIAAAAVASHREPIQQAIAAAWLREMRLRMPIRAPVPRAAPSPPPRPLSPAKPPSPPPKKHDPPIRQAIKALEELVQLERSAPPPRPPAPAPPAQAMPQVTQPAKPAPPPALRRNGVVLHPDGRLDHRGQTVRINRPEGVRLVAALLTVMPSILPADRTIPKAFGRALPDDGPRQLRDLVAWCQPVLAGARLTIKDVPKIGHTLYDLGPA